MYQEIYRALEENGTVRTAVILSGKDCGRRCLIREDGCGLDPFWKPYEKALTETDGTGLLEIGGTEIFAEVFQKNPRLIILGGGHVSCPTARIGKMLGFHVTVMDDREEFLTRERFPDADCLIKGSFEEFSEKIPVYENAYYVVVTRGHLGDSVCARQILKRPYTYFGMIGSKTKVRLTREKLLGEGFTQEQLDTIHAPIGIPLGGQMPAEIAVSIMAQIVQVKNSRKNSFCDEDVEKRVLEGAHGVMCTIVEKEGSSPRDAGSRMLVESDGKLTGSIGGGNVEFAAVKHCPEVDRFDVASYDLSNGEQGKLGMICGGRVRVLFERI